MSIAVLTSFNQSYYDKLGKYMVNSFVKYWPKDITLHIYNEDIELPYIADNVKLMGFDLGENYNNFAQRDHKQRIKIFAKKAFSWLHAVKTIDADKIIWMDSDCQTIKPVPYHFLDSICPNNRLTAHMGIWYYDKKTREGAVKLENPIFCPETGFNIINKKHKDFKIFIERYEDYYVSNKGVDLRRFYDNDVFGAVVQTMPSKNFMELNPGFHKTAMSKTILAEYFKHYKGKVKKQETFAVKES
jgi:hypothetical protein